MFARSDEIRSGEKLVSCHYLRACIDEALRMSPPVPGILWRKPRDGTGNVSEPFVVDGYTIPRGTQVGLSIYSFLHNGDFFSDSYSFRPERWLSPNPEDCVEAMREAFIPFSTGCRGCPGQDLAYLEMSLVAAKMLWYFDFEVAPGEPGQVGAGELSYRDGRKRNGGFKIYEALNSVCDGPNLLFYPREEYYRELISVTSSSSGPDSLKYSQSTF